MAERVRRILFRREDSRWLIRLYTGDYCFQQYRQCRSDKRRKANTRPQTTEMRWWFQFDPAGASLRARYSLEFRSQVSRVKIVFQWCIRDEEGQSESSEWNRAPKWKHQTEHINLDKICNRCSREHRDTTASIQHMYCQLPLTKIWSYPRRDPFFLFVSDTREFGFFCFVAFDKGT